jgi:signal transduction histidine kinase
MSESTSIPLPKPKPARQEAWKRWVLIWHVVFYLSLAIPTILALLAEEVNRPKTNILALSLGLGAWYALVMIWLISRVSGRYQVIWSIVYLVGAVVLWFPLARTHWAYFITASSFYGLMWGTLPFGLAVGGNVILTAVIIWVQALNLGRSVILSPELFLISAVVVGWAALLALWMRTVMRESEQRKKLIEQLEATREELAEAEHQAGVLQERQRVAQEIHDTLAQGFTSIVMQLEAAEQALPGDLPAVKERIEKARQTARLNLKEARRLVLALQPEPLQQGSLVEALRRESQRWSQTSGINTHFSVTGTPIGLHPQCEVTLLRALQEGTNNVFKHAQATEVNITLSFMEHQIALDIQDDGVGFNPQELDSPDGSGGFGLLAMEQRINEIDGGLVIESSPGHGTTLVIQVPIEVAALEND